MTQSSHSHQIRVGKKRADSKIILLQRDGELSEFLAVLTELDVPTINCLSGLPTAEQIETARLVIATAERLLESGSLHLSNWPRTFAVVQKSSKTLSTHLSRIGVTMILQRPIHPRALRLLLLHELYRGPEKRERGRTLIGRFVRVKSGLFGTQGRLIDLSPTSARLQLAKAPKPESTLRIQLDRELTQGAPLKLKARVIRCSRLPAQQGFEVGLGILDALSHQKAIQSILERFASGPASWDSDSRYGQSAAGSAVATHSPDQTPKPQAEPEQAPPATAAAPGPTRSESPSPGAPPASSGQPDESLEIDTQEIETPDVEPAERRTQPRIPYEHRVVALDEEAARVLLACDLSEGGMRIVSNATIPIGAEVRIALHSGAQIEPLTLRSRVIRDDGPDGMVLAFENLDPTQREDLLKIIASSGQIHEVGDPDAAQSKVDDFLVIGELLDELDFDFDDEVEDGDLILDTDDSIEDVL